MALTVTSQQIDELRSTFLQELEKDGKVIHQADLSRIKNSDDWLRRFLLHHDLDQKLALKMMFETTGWRKDFKANDITENNIRMDYLVDGSFFSRGRDKDGCSLLIFRCKKHIKGAKDFEELKRCIVYWFERLEREEKGKQVSLFFDMDGCGLTNMDMELVKYLIGMFKLYYPFFLNYILIFEMSWVLNAAFKIIKSWLPEKAIQKIKFLGKADITQFVPVDQALKAWGGLDDYTFSFVPEESPIMSTPLSSKKVHFADGSPMTEQSTVLLGEKDQEGALAVNPSNVITFVKEGNELVSTLELQNNDEKINISYKMKTTSPEKFRVRPSAGCLEPGATATITVTLLPGFQLGGLSRDKFLVMSMPIDHTDFTPQELIDLWKNTSAMNVSQHRLRCAQTTEITKNGSAIPVASVDHEQSQINQMLQSIGQLRDCQSKLHGSVRQLQLMQWLTIALTLLLGLALLYLVKFEGGDSKHSCYRKDEL